MTSSAIYIHVLDQILRCEILNTVSEYTHNNNFYRCCWLFLTRLFIRPYRLSVTLQLPVRRLIIVQSTVSYPQEFGYRSGEGHPTDTTLHCYWSVYLLPLAWIYTCDQAKGYYRVIIVSILACNSFLAMADGGLPEGRKNWGQESEAFTIAEGRVAWTASRVCVSDSRRQLAFQ